jgi:hypothetical protein
VFEELQNRRVDEGHGTGRHRRKRGLKALEIVKGKPQLTLKSMSVGSKI